MRLCKHEYDISRSLCPLCAVEAKEGAVANAEADRDHWKKEAEGWRVQFTNAANVADKLKEQLDETKLFSGDIDEALRRAVEEANRTGQAMGAAAERERIAAWLEALDADGGIAEASEMQPYLHGRVRNGAHKEARTVEPRDTEPPSMDAEDVAAWRRWAASRVGLRRRCSCMRDALDQALGLDYRSIEAGDTVITNDGPVTVTKVDDARTVCGREEYDAAEVEIDRRDEVVQEGTPAPEPRRFPRRWPFLDRLPTPYEWLERYVDGAVYDDDKINALAVEHLAALKPPEESLPEGARRDANGGVQWQRGGRLWVFHAEDDGVACVVDGGRPVHKSDEWMTCANAALANRGTPGSTEPGLNTPEPPPTGDGAEVWPLVIADMEERNREGVRKYGTPLRAHNGRKALVDLYQELLDATVYCRQHIEEGTPGSTEP